MSRKCRGNSPIIGKLALAIPFLVVYIGVSPMLAGGQTAVTTYHYDNYRTGWNQNESQLTPAQVGSSSFGLLQTVTLDAQVDAQPLVVPGVVITAGPNQGAHDVVYVATENNTVYAIDVHSGTVLLSPNFGPPTGYPLGCNSSGRTAGINSTPVIDLASNTLYVMVYTSSSGNPTYILHALDLGSLTDQVTPQVVSASHTLTDGSTSDFNAMYQRQRPALLLANGGVYAAFGSFCDLVGDYISRGWLLGWVAGSMTPFPLSQLNNQHASDANGVYLSSIWMSGYGPSVDDEGNILFVSGNSDFSGTTYDGVTNIPESVVKVSPTLGSVVDLFTPANQSSLDQGDLDFGSGGVLVLPDQPGSTPHLAVAAGKYGTMYLMNEDSLGGYSPTTNNVLGEYPEVGGCWCGQSYYVDPMDGMGTVVSSGGNTVEAWEVQTSPTVALTHVASAQISASYVQDPGFFTSISSNGPTNPIIWAVSRPASSANGSPIQLYAFNPDSSGGAMSTLYQGIAGSWPNTGADADVVPVVANGLVFVASYKQLQIFGLAGTANTTTTLASSLNPSALGQSVLLTATISAQSGGGIPTGTVTFYDGATALTTLSLLSASAQYSTAALPASSNSITAVYGGSAAYSGSTSSPLIQVVQTGTGATATTLTSSLNPSLLGKQVIFSATVSSQSGGIPAGTVTFYDGMTALAAVSIKNGTAHYTATLPTGSNSITAAYGGSATYIASASSALMQVVQAVTTSTVTSSPGSPAFGQPVTFTASVSSSVGAPPDGETVTFEHGAIVLGTGTLSGGVATLSTSALATGSYSITVVYGGDSNFTFSKSKAVKLVVGKASSTTSLISSLNPSIFGQAVTFTATVAPEFSGTPTGNVTFKIGTVDLATVPLRGAVASYTTTKLAIGTDSLTAVYNGSSSFTPSTSTALSHVVNSVSPAAAPSSSVSP